MPNANVTTVRTAYEAYARGDLPTMLGFIDPELEWTYLDPSYEDPEPQVCHGRRELQTALERQAERGLMSELEEVIGNGDRVVVIVRTPGVDAYRVRKADDRNCDVLTVHEGRSSRSMRAAIERRRWGWPVLGSDMGDRLDPAPQRDAFPTAITPAHLPWLDRLSQRSPVPCCFQ